MTTRMFRMFVVASFFVLTLSFSFPNAALAQPSFQTGCVPGVWTEGPGGGITSGTAPAAVVRFPDLQLFMTGDGDLIYTNVFHGPGSFWSGWSEVPGNFRAGGTGPAAVVFQSKLYLFALSPTG